MKIHEILNEMATGGSTSAGSIASISNPLGSGISRRPSIFGYVETPPKKTKKKKKKKTKESLEYEKLPSVTTHTPEEIAKHHNVSLQQIKKQLKRGIEVEYEHTQDKALSREIALDHLLELPDYYTKLDKMENMNESMDFSAGIKGKDGVFRSVIGGELPYDFSSPPWNDMTYQGWNSKTQSYDDPPRNPNYNPELELNLSNANADRVAQELGLEDAESLHMPVDQFIGLATQWLKKNVGKQSEREPSEISRYPGGPTMIGGDKPEGYFNKIIYKMVMIAKKGKEKGAEYVWFA